MNDFLSWLLVASWQGIVLIALVLALRGILRDRLSASWRASLWLIVLARLALPIAPSANFSIFNLAGVTHRVQAEARSLVQGPPLPPSPVIRHNPRLGPEPRTAADVPPAFYENQDPHATARQIEADLSRGLTPTSYFLVWVFGAGIVLAMIAFTAGRILELMRQSVPLARPDVDAIIASCAAELNWKGKVRVVESPAFASPAVVGWLRPRLVLPEGLADRLSEQDLRAVILHELAHMKRWDVPLSWAAALVLLLHWFNPLAWLAVWLMRRDRELACDELAIATMKNEERFAYGETLLKLLEKAKGRSPLPGVAAIVEDRSGVQRRIAMIAGFRPKTSLGTFVSGALCMMLAAATLTNASERPQAAAAGAQPKVAGVRVAGVEKINDRSLEFYIKPYARDKDSLVRMGEGVQWHVQSKYIGVDDNNNQSIDDRTTVVIQDTNKQFWPVIMKLSDHDSAKLLEDFKNAVANRKKDLAERAKECVAEPKHLEVVLSPNRLQPDENGMSPHKVGRWYIHPDNPGVPHLTVELTWLMETPASPQTNVGSVKMSVTDAENLIAQMEAIAKERAGGDNVVVGVPIKGETDVLLATKGLKLNEWGVGELPANATLRAYAFYSGIDAAGKNFTDDRLTIVLDNPDAHMWNMVAKLSDTQAAEFAANLREAIAGRAGDAPAGVSAVIATKPYKLDANGTAQLAGVALRAYSVYNGIGEDNKSFTDNRVTVVADDPANSFWGMVVKMDDVSARKFLETIEASMSARKNNQLPPGIRKPTR